MDQSFAKANPIKLEDSFGVIPIVNSVSDHSSTRSPKNGKMGHLDHISEDGEFPNAYKSFHSANHSPRISPRPRRHSTIMLHPSTVSDNSSENIQKQTQFYRRLTQQFQLDPSELAKEAIKASKNNPGDQSEKFATWVEVANLVKQQQKVLTEIPIYSDHVIKKATQNQPTTILLLLEDKEEVISKEEDAKSEQKTVKFRSFNTRASMNRFKTKPKPKLKHKSAKVPLITGLDESKQQLVCEIEREIQGLVAYLVTLGYKGTKINHKVNIFAVS